MKKAKKSIKKLSAVFKKIKRSIRSIQARRPHKSFVRTRRRDYARSLDLPGYWNFTIDVTMLLWKNKKLFGSLVVLYVVVTLLLGGINSILQYGNISNVVSSTADDTVGGFMAVVSQAFVLSVTSFSIASFEQATSTQQIYISFVALMLWLTVVWLLRELMAQRSPRLRDGLYNAGAPIVSTIIVMLIILVQLIPAGIMTMIYAALTSTGLIDFGFGAMLFAFAALLVAALTLQWLTASALALVIVTLPGMYPYQALKAAGDLIVSRRLRVMLRLIWMFLVAALAWLFVTMPLIALDSWAKSAFDWAKSIPLVPIVTTVLSVMVVIWLATYVYLLYRKIVADDAPPA